MKKTEYAVVSDWFIWSFLKDFSMNGGSLLLNQKENVQAMDMFSEFEEALLVMTERELSFEVLMKFGMIDSILKSIWWIYSFPRQLVTSNAV